MEVHECCVVCRRRLSPGTSVPVLGDPRQSCFRRACVVELARRLALEKASIADSATGGAAG